MGAWTMKEKSMIFAVTTSALSVSSSVRTRAQEATPSSVISLSPSQRVKLSARTPSSGTIAKTTKNTRAGAASHPDGPAARARREAVEVRAVVGAKAIAYLPIVAFIAETNCSGVIFLRKIWSRFESIVSPWAGLSAWSHESVKLGASLAMP